MENLLDNIKKNVKFGFTKEVSHLGPIHYTGKFLSKLDNSFIISTPKFDSKMCELEVGEILDLFVYTPKGVYNIQSRVLNIFSEKQECEISYPTFVKYSQRREFLRADIQAKALLKIEYSDGRVENFDVTTNNICGRGINFDSNINIMFYKSIKVELELTSRKILSDADIVYVKSFSKNGDLAFNTALMFTTISDDDINFIVKECFLYKLKENVQEHESNV